VQAFVTPTRIPRKTYRALLESGEFSGALFVRDRGTARGMLSLGGKAKDMAGAVRSMQRFRRAHLAKAPRLRLVGNA
jgi:hypothetical protein